MPKTTKPTTPTLQERYLALPDVRLHVAEAGDDGPLVVLLHGFPDFWYTWRELMPALAASGCRVVAPDMRGYHTSDKPEGVGAYRLDTLARDVANLIDALGERDATVVGHDWGGIVAWHTALRHPDRVRRLGILNAPPPLPLLAHMPPPDQFLRSWYVAGFQVPVVPEAVLSFNDYAALRRALSHGTRRSAIYTQADWDRYETAWRQPGALTAMVNYYRALALYGPWDTTNALSASGGYQGDTLVLWGDQDPYLAPPMAEPSLRSVPNARTVHFEDAGHWVHIDKPDEVSQHLASFVKGA